MQPVGNKVLAWMVLVISLVNAVFLSLNLAAVNTATEQSRGNREMLCATLKSRIDDPDMTNRQAQEDLYHRRCQ